MITKFHISLIATIALASGGQLALKAGAARDGSLLEQLLHGYTIVALLAYLLSAVSYMYALRGIPVSVAFPGVSISAVVVVAVVAHYFWKEPFGIQQFVAVALIGAGIFLLFRNHP